MLLLLALSPMLAAAAPQDRGMTQERFVAARKERLLAADANKDGSLSLEEWKQARAGAGGDPARVFATIDADKNGSASAAEIDAFITARFAKLDANGDKVLTRDEAQAAKGAGAPKTEE
jgi:hypothetical protein